MNDTTWDPDQAEKPERPGRPGRRWVRTTVLIVGLGAAMLGANAVAAGVQNAALSLVVGPALAAGMIALYVWAGRHLERRTVTEFPRESARRHVVLGTLGGLGLATLSIGIIALFGGYRITGWGSLAGALALVGTMCAVAVSEEVFFRGVVFRLLQGRWGATVALLASAAIFGLLHLVNPGASLWGAVAVAVEAGLILGAAYLLTGSLWLAIGLHLGWNVAIGGIFGTVVSGSAARDALLTGATSGPEWLTGGAFGPEGSVVSIVVCLAATGVLLWVAHRRGRVLGGMR